MNTIKYIDIFVSHRWKYNDDYHKLIDNLKTKTSSLVYAIRDYSVPEHDPIDEIGQKKLWAEIVEHIRQCSVFIVFNGMYINHSGFIDREIEKAVEFGKPILIIKHWDSERTPLQLTKLVNSGYAKFVGWNIDPIYLAIKRLAGVL